MTYDPTDGTTLTELIRLVRMEAHDFPYHVETTATGNGVKTVFPLDGTPYAADSVTCTVEGAAETGFTVDYDTGEVTFTSAPTGDIIFYHSCVTWTDERITIALNRAINEMFGAFHVPGINDELTYTGPETLAETSDGDDLGPEDRITRVECWHDPYWVRVTDWEVFTDGTSKYIRFHRAMADDTTLRIHYVVRPGNLSSGSQTLEGTAGLPGRAVEPIVLLALSGLIKERVHTRIKDDRAHNQQGDNAVKSYEILNDANALRAQAEVAMQRLKMPGLTARLLP